MFVSSPPIPNIESFSQYTISSLDSGSFGRNQADMNIQQQTTSKVANIEIVIADNKDLDSLPPQYIPILFAVVDLSSHSSCDSDKYKCACINAKLISSSILSAGEFPDACSRALYIALNHKEIAPIIELTGAMRRAS